MRISDWSSDVCSSDLTAEYDALLRIGDRAAQCVLADRDRLGRDQYTFGVQAVEDIAEALAFLTDPILFGDEQSVDEDRVRIDRLATHFRNLVDVDLRAIKIGVEDGDAVGRTRAVLELDRKSTRLNSSH